MLAFSGLHEGQRVTVRARAKVNLGLEVLGRRADGYHELRSLLWAIDLADQVTLEATAEGIVVQCGAPGVPENADNLAWRAAELMRRQLGVDAGVRIKIDKVIPVAAGLGGGSADAAAVLVGLGPLWGVRLSRPRLRALATELGMDVPFFLQEGPAVAFGRGEQLRAVPAPRAVALVLVNPGVPLATRDVYAALRPDDFTSGARVRALVAGLRDGAAGLAARVFNGLEGAALRLWPGLAEVREALGRAGALAAVMSGSGPTVIGIAPSRPAAFRIQKAVARRGWRTWVTRTVAGPALSIRPGAPPPRGMGGDSSWGVAKR